MQITIDFVDPKLLVPFWVQVLDHGSRPAREPADLERLLAQRRRPDEEIPADHDAADSIVTQVESSRGSGFSRSQKPKR